MILYLFAYNYCTLDIMLSKYAYFEPKNKQITTTKPNISLGSYIYFFFLWMIRNIYLTTYKIKNFYKKPENREPSIQELSKKFVEKRTEEFLRQYKAVKYPNMNVDPIFYNKKQYIELQLSESNELENMWKSRILFQNTPRGNIAMFYNVYKLGFSYYCDVNMPYDILNAVAMKYVIMNQCRDFFLDEEITPVESPLLKLVEDDKDARYFTRRGVSILLGGKKIGSMGVLHPEVIGNFELKYPVSALEVDFDAMFNHFKGVK